MIESWSRGVRPYFLLALLGALLYFPGIAALPVLDRDEARFAQATRQMIESGDYLRIRFQDEARNKKPAGIYWLQAASVRLFGDAEAPAIWPYRLPSAFGALAAVLLAFGLGKNFVGRKEALIGAALLAATLEPIAEAHIAKTDAVLLALAVAAQGALGILYRGARTGAPVPWGWALLFWAAQGLAILIKGPIVPVLSLFAVIALGVADRDARWLRQLRAWWGLPLAVLIVAPWFIAINIATQGGFVAEAVGHDLLGKLIGAQEGHGAPPLTHLAVLLAAFWPAILFLGRGIARAWFERRGVAERFLIAWFVPFWILVELVPTKLPQYLLPAYPALALLIGRALVAGEPRWRRLDLIGGVLFAIVGVALAAGLVLLPIRYGAGLDPSTIAVAILLIAVGAAALWTRVPALAVLASVIVAIPATQVVAPRLEAIFVSEGAARLAHSLPASALPVAVVGYNEPSLIFLLGTRTAILPPDRAAEALAQGKIAGALVSRDREADFTEAMKKIGGEPRTGGNFAGLDYSTGKDVRLTLYPGR